MLTLAEAQHRIVSSINPLEDEVVDLKDAANRILRQEVLAAIDLPRFNNSAMDGYAVRSGDLALATDASPVALHLTGTAAAGRIYEGSMSAGSCVRVFTGSLLPGGADAVVMQEDVRIRPEMPNRVWFSEPVEPLEFVRREGEDVRVGDVLAGPGERLGAGHVALLGAVGTARVRVGRRPIVGLLATGNELREPGSSLAEGQIYESNRAAIAVMAAQAGAQPRWFPLVPDDADVTRRALSTAFAECDAVITSGGVSVGELDFVKSAFEGIGGRLEFWKVAMKPGKPFVFGHFDRKRLFGLPGNPLSALVTFHLLVRPALLRLQGAADWSLPVRRCELAESLVNKGDRPHFICVSLEAGAAKSAGKQGSHRLRGLAQAEGLVEVPAGSTLPAGRVVSVLAWV